MGQRNQQNTMQLFVSWRWYYKGHCKKDFLQTDWQCYNCRLWIRIPHHTQMCKQKNDLVNKQDMAEVLFQEQDPYIFWRAHHKELCADIQGGLMSCSDCGEIISTSDIINHCLQEGNTIILGERSHHYRPDTIIPLSR